MSSSRRPPFPFRLPRFTRTLPAAALLAVAGCSAGPATVAVPSPSPAQAAMCRALHRALPRTFDGLPRHDPSPASDFTAAWGDPPVVLRCGVPAPAVLTPTSPHYDPSAQAEEIDGVDWLPERQPDGSVRCTTTLRKAYVEVTLPEKYVGQYGDLGPLTALAPAVRAAVPAGL